MARRNVKSCNIHVTSMYLRCIFQQIFSLYNIIVQQRAYMHAPPYSVNKNVHFAYKIPKFNVQNMSLNHCILRIKTFLKTCYNECIFGVYFDTVLYKKSINFEIMT